MRQQTEHRVLLLAVLRGIRSGQDGDPLVPVLSDVQGHGFGLVGMIGESKHHSAHNTGKPGIQIWGIGMDRAAEAIQIQLFDSRALYIGVLDPELCLGP